MGLILTGGFLVWTRYAQNQEQIFPYPYHFISQAPAIQLDAPILITGDRMGKYFAKFQTELAATISQNLAKPIKIQSLAKDGFALHRTLHELRSLTQWPQILIYQGGSEEMGENKFELPEIPKIVTNFKRYNDDRIETLLILYPKLSRLIYEPIKKVKLAETPVITAQGNEAEYLKRLEMEILLFEQQLIQLVGLSKDRNSLLILTTTPVNMDISPHKVCSFTTTVEIEEAIGSLRDLIRAKNHKAAYAMSTKLTQQYSGNALLLYIHGQVARRLGKNDEAKKALLESSAFDCEPWRANEIHNSIIRKVAKEQQVMLFDFAKLVENQWPENPTFFDELYAQNLNYDRAMKQLGLVIKNILKL